ncbi:PKD-like family lipoprotein [Butyricimonas sp.]|uniref:PKD-like family lipoprotein n=1 Tax=Butyricimonas sp. TaxID=1969738 RepID=UPI0025B90D3A|nr:PKD-like family lipoprotein [Butyricimonas sp.]
MKRLMKYSNLILGSLLLLSSCYDDKGSYDYHEVNEVNIELPATIGVRLSKEEAVAVVIEPTLSQTLEKNEEQLTYKWEKMVENPNGLDEWVVCGEEKKCELWFEAKDTKPLSLRLRVLDHRKDGSEWYKQTTVQPIVPYSSSWFVLQDDGGKGVLGVLDGEGSAGVVVADVYRADMKQELPINGKPKYLYTELTYGARTNTVASQKPVIFIGTDHELNSLDAISFETVYTYQEMLAVKKVNGESDFDLDWSLSNTYLELGELLSNNGKLYIANSDGYGVFYPLEWENEADASEYKVTSAAPLSGIGHILYDEQNHRFLRCASYYDDYYDLAYNKLYRMGRDQFLVPDKTLKKLSKIGENSKYENAFNPDNIGDDKKLISMNMYMYYNAGWSYGVLATFFSTADSKIHVYDLNSGGWSSNATNAKCMGEYTFDLPVGMNVDELKVETSYVYYKTLFLAGGNNKIYKMDFNRLVPKMTELYEHENAAVKITGLKFRNSYTNWGHSTPNGWETYDFPYYLAFSLDYGGNEGGFVEMKLTGAGDIDKDFEVTEYKGFGKIVDFGYSMKL